MTGSRAMNFHIKRDTTSPFDVAMKLAEVRRAKKVAFCDFNSSRLPGPRFEDERRWRLELLRFRSHFQTQSNDDANVARVGCGRAKGG
jgi:hypothetical protein